MHKFKIVIASCPSSTPANTVTASWSVKISSLRAHSGDEGSDRAQHLAVLSACGAADIAGALGGLQVLNVAGCSSLTALPEALGALTGLQELDLTGCSGLLTLPESLGALTGLQKLKIWECVGLAVLPESLGSLFGLQELAQVAAGCLPCQSRWGCFQGCKCSACRAAARLLRCQSPWGR